jgi:DNA-binding NarL/FixJ family response regulator
MHDNLNGRAILVVEDEYFIAIDLQRALLLAGSIVIGPASSLEKTIELIERVATLDGAILDINVGGERIFPVADLLAGRQVPFVFTTGYDEAAIPFRFANVARCQKPVSVDTVMEALSQVIQARPTPRPSSGAPAA